MRKAVTYGLFVAYLVAVGLLITHGQAGYYRGDSAYGLFITGLGLVGLLGGVLFRLDHLLGFCQNREHQPARIAAGTLIFALVLVLCSLQSLLLRLFGGHYPHFLSFLAQMPQTLAAIIGFAGGVLIVESCQRGPKKSAVQDDAA